MDNNAQSFKSLVSKSDKVLLIFPYFINADTCASIGLLYKLLTTEFHKDVDVASSRAIPRRYHTILEKAGIKLDSIINEIAPISYVIGVNDALKDSVDVKWHRKDSNLQIVLTPETQEIDFGKITFSREGGIYDLVITLNVSRLEDLGNVYTKSEKQFTKYDIVTFNYRLRTINEAKLALSHRDASTTVEVVQNLISDLEIPMNQDYAELVLHGVIGTEGVSGAYKNTAEVLSTVSKLAQRFNINLNSIISQYTNSLSHEEIRLYERMFRNLNFDETKSTVYSFLTASDFSQTGTKASDIDGLINLPFNLNHTINVAFLAYQDGENYQIIVESNDPNFDMSALLKRLDGYGDRFHGIAEVEGTLDEVLKIVLGGTAPKQPTVIPANPVEVITPDVQPKSQETTISRPTPIAPPKLPTQPVAAKTAQPQNQPKDQQKLREEKAQAPKDAPKEPRKDSREQPKQEQKPQQQRPAPAPVPVPQVPANQSQRPVQQPIQTPQVMPQQPKPADQKPAPAQQPVHAPQVVQQQPKAQEQKPVLAQKPAATPAVPREPQVVPQTPAPQQAPQKPPFQKAQDFMIDPYAEAMKKAPTFSSQNKPFDPGV